MALISIPFDEEIAYQAAFGMPEGLEIALPDELNESVWERLSVIKELTYPLPLIVTFSPAWLEGDLEGVLTRLAVSFVSGISLKNSFDSPLISQINLANHLGLSIIK